MTWIRKKPDGTHESFNFEAPEKTAGQIVGFPAFVAQENPEPDGDTGEYNLELNVHENFVALGVDDDITINAVVSERLTAGARLTLALTCDATPRAVTFGEGFQEGTTATLPDGETSVLNFLFINGAFRLTNTGQTIEVSPGGDGAKKTAYYDAEDLISVGENSYKLVIGEDVDIAFFDFLGKGSIELDIGHNPAVCVIMHIVAEEDAVYVHDGLENHTVSMGTIAQVLSIGGYINSVDGIILYTHVLPTM